MTIHVLSDSKHIYFYFIELLVRWAKTHLGIIKWYTHMEVPAQQGKIKILHKECSITSGRAWWIFKSPTDMSSYLNIHKCIHTDINYNRNTYTLSAGSFHLSLQILAICCLDKGTAQFQTELFQFCTCSYMGLHAHFFLLQTFSLTIFLLPCNYI